jgi:hypothetical protein
MGTSRLGPTWLVTSLLLAGCGGAPAAPTTTTAPARAPVAEPDPVEAATARLLARRMAATLLAMSLADREQVIYEALYNEVQTPKPRPFDQAEYDRRLAARTERAATRGPWHVRHGVDGTADLSVDARRIYLDVVPEHAALLADDLTSTLDARGVRRFSLKILSALDTFDIPVPAVLYVEAPDYPVAREVALAFGAAHPDALWPEEPPLTRRLATGIAAADEIGAVGPEGVAGNSFAGAMAHLFAVALEGAPPDVSASVLAARMRDALSAAGFDPARPWLRPGRTNDDL